MPIGEIPRETHSDPDNTEMLNEYELCVAINKAIDKKLFGMGVGDWSDEEEAELVRLELQLAGLDAGKIIAKAEAKQVIKKRVRKVNKQFKRDEDWGNAELGLERQGHMRRGLPCADGVNDMFSVEYTRTKKPLAYIWDKISEAVGHVTYGRIPVVVIFQDGYDRGDAVVVLRFRDFKDLHGNERG